MRVIGGSLRGRRFVAPTGLDTRPTADRVRQTLFDVLGQRCDDLRVLDLFAGTGSLGIEAISRGASSCVFVESSRKTLSILKKNILSLGLEDRALILSNDALTVHGYQAHAPFDLILADPPYSMNASQVLERIAASSSTLLRLNARVVVEHSRHNEPEDGFPSLVQVDRRQFGESILTFYVFNKEIQ